jgi:hypothetical protein
MIQFTTIQCPKCTDGCEGKVYVDPKSIRQLVARNKNGSFFYRKND